MKPLDPMTVARTHESEQDSRIGVVSRALIASAERADRLAEALRPFADLPLGPAGYCSLPLAPYVEAANIVLKDQP
jgi:hypothetical protein